jgi:hypothetical protein
MSGGQAGAQPPQTTQQDGPAASEGTQKEPAGGFKPTIHVGGYGILRYIYSKEDGGDGEFDIEELALIISGDLSRKFDYFAEAEVEDGRGEVEVESFQVTYRPAPNHHLVFGLFQVPFGLRNERLRPFRDRLSSRARLREVVPIVWSEVGISPRGYFDLGPTSQVGYSAFLGNGLGEGESIRDGRQLFNENGQLAGGGRINFVPFRNAELGASAYRGNYSEDGKQKLVLLGVHARFGFWKLELEGEYARAELDLPEGFPESDIHSFYAQGGLWLTKKLMAVYRLDRLRYLDAYHGDGFEPGTAGEGIDDDMLVHNAGLFFNPVGPLILKVEVQFFDHKRSADDTQVNVEAVIHF